MTRIGLLCGIAGTSLLAGMASAQTATQPAEPNAASSANTTAVTGPVPTTTPISRSTSNPAGADIIVTARRRDEKLQDVPVSVTAFSSAALERKTVQQISDLGKITPGFTFSAEGGKNNVTLSLRGIGQIPLGEGTPGVAIYLNNQALPSNGGNIPTYDIASIQVLKGPQGTLFGKNTLGGAVLITSQQPTYKFGGYVEGTYGRFDYKEFQGAVNIPLITDKVALRVAGQVRRQDPRTGSLDGGPGYDNIHQDSARVSLLLTPFDGFKSTTIGEYFREDDLSGGNYLLRQNFPFAALVGPVIGGALDAQVQAELANQRAHRRSAYDDGLDGGISFTKAKSIVNDTSYNFGPMTLRNIFTYRTSRFAVEGNTGAVGGLTIPSQDLGLPAGGALPFTLFHAAAASNRRYLTNETQLFGTFDRFNFIIGTYYNNDRPHGPGGSQFTAFSIGGVPSPTVTSQVDNTNEAIYGQIGYKLTDKLTINAGARYSHDKVAACGGEVFTNTYATYAQCKAVAASGSATDGIGVIKNKSSEPSYTIDVDYKVTPNWLLYAEHRRGFRAANVNTPLFETYYTTCQGVPANGPGQCFDLRGVQKTGVEKLYDFEIGSKLTYHLSGATGHWNTAIYRDTYKGALQFFNTQTLVAPQAPDSPDHGSVGINAADETIWGVETEFDVSPTENFNVSFNGAYTHVKIDRLITPAGFPAGIFTKSNVNKFSPTFSGTVAASWTLPFHPLDGDLIANGDIFMTDDFGGQDGEKLPGYKLLNARLDWKGIAGTGLDLGVYVRNLTNEFYFAATSVQLRSFPTSSVFVAEPRTWGVSARYRF